MKQPNPSSNFNLAYLPTLILHTINTTPVCSKKQEPCPSRKLRSELVAGIYLGIKNILKTPSPNKFKNKDRYWPCGHVETTYMILRSEAAAGGEVQCQQYIIRKPRLGCKVPKTVCSCSIPTEAYFTTGIIPPPKQLLSFLHLASHLNTKPLDGSNTLDGSAPNASLSTGTVQDTFPRHASETTRMVDWALALHFGSMAKPLVQ
jgi:hypothetical protein